jgi:FMN-dependent NADH-azoreductase
MSGIDMCGRTFIDMCVRTYSLEADMTRLLHISASPRGNSSESGGLAASVLEEVRTTRPDIEVAHWDLWDGTLPEFGPLATAGKMEIFAGREPSGDMVAEWDAAVATFHRFAAADIYLFSVPMWNHTIPYKLKQLIDVVSQPGLVFGFDPDTGYTGLLAGKRAVTIYTGAVWGPGASPAFGRDFLQPYFSDWQRWAGIEVVREIRFQPNLVTSEAAAAREIARAEAVAAVAAL